MTWNRRIAVAVALLALPAAVLVGQGDVEFKEGKWVRVAEPKEGTPAGELMLIREYLHEDEPKDAFEAAKDFLDRYPQTQKREEVMLLAGEAQMARGRYSDAYDWFERQISEYPTGRFFRRALQREYEIADAFLKGRKKRLWHLFRVDATDDGLEILTRIVEQAPGTAIARKSLLRMGDHYFEQARYPAAVDMYDQFLRIYGKSDQAAYAMLRAARASRLQYRGPKYDATPLRSARQRYTAFVERFPTQAKKLDIERVRREIVDMLAEKTFRTGLFYERVDRPKAADFYYRQVLTTFPRSAWASDAEAKLRGRRKPAAQPRRETTTKPTKLESLVPDNKDEK
ncbi:MAG: outer membrane protein assembly factor BamD [Phycisphaerae bacterium]